MSKIRFGLCELVRACEFAKHNPIKNVFYEALKQSIFEACAVRSCRVSDLAYRVWEVLVDYYKPHLHSKDSHEDPGCDGRSDHAGNIGTYGMHKQEVTRIRF